MRRTRANLTDAIGTDSFLDIVANLVGILLILLMVIGARMDDVSDEPEPILPAVGSQASLPEELLAPVAMPDVDAARLELQRVESSIHEAESETDRLAALIKLQKLDRDNLMLAIAHAERELELRRSELDASQQEQLATDVQMQRAEDEYQSILGQLESMKLALEQKRPEVLQHVATPIAKTVFVREEHFRLKDGRLMYVPLNEMTAQLRTEAPKKVWKLERAQQVTETIGPRQGFQMRYTLRRNRVPFQTESGLRAVREVVELDRFVMVPVGKSPGETVLEALEPTSTFRSRLSGWDPRETIVTVWTYPDSFGDFRELKSQLYQLGFLTAARPLPAGQLISGSPDGTRSAAQ